MKSLTSLLAPVTAGHTTGDALADRGALLGGLTFVEGAPGWTGADVVEWFSEHLVSPGRMMRPTSMQEPSVGAYALDSWREPHPRSLEPSRGGQWVSHGDTSPAELEPLLSDARGRVVKILRAFIASPPDDRFLKTAIFSDRVQRRRVEKRSVWVARPTESDALSDIVLSLFAVDILMNREFHEAKLCVCDVCGRVSFQPGATTRSGCGEHRPRSETNSGFVLSQSNPKLPSNP